MGGGKREHTPPVPKIKTEPVTPKTPVVEEVQPTRVLRTRKIVLDNPDLQKVKKPKVKQERFDEIHYIQLNDYCLGKILSLLGFKDRLRAQRVNRQWLRVGQEFTRLNVNDFKVDANCALKDVEGPLFHNESLWLKDNRLENSALIFHWEAFLRTLARSRGSVRHLDLSKLTDQEVTVLQPYINDELCRGVDHLEIGPYVRKEVLSEPHYVTEGECKRLQGVAVLCSLKRLPRLKSLVLCSAQNINGTTLKTITNDVLPYLQALEVKFDDFDGKYNKYLTSRTSQWTEFFKKLPKNLERLAIDCNKEQYYHDHLPMLLARANMEPPLAKLRSLTLNRYNCSPWKDTDKHLAAGYLKDDLAKLCSKLGKQLTEFKVTKNHKAPCCKTHQMFGAESLSNLRVFKVEVHTFGNLQHFDLILRRMTHLQVLHLHFEEHVRGTLDETLATLCLLTNLVELSVQWKFMSALFLNEISETLVNLRRFLSPAFARTRLSEQFLGFLRDYLVKLVRQCTHLELLDLSELQDVDFAPALLGQMETALLQARPAPQVCPHPARRQHRGARDCDLCPSPLVPLRVILGASFKLRWGEESPQVKRFNRSTVLRLSYMV